MRLVKSARWRGYETLTFEQKMQLNQFRVRVVLSYSVMYVALITLIFDLGVAAKLAPWLTSIIGFIIGWWMPSPGNVATQNTNQISTEIDNAIVVTESDQKL